VKEPVAGSERDELLPRDWAELGPLVDQVLDAAPEARAALIGELAAGNAARQRALEQLVAECERDLPLLNRVASERFDALAREPQESLLPELLADRYRTGRELGRGGMARVYLARDTKHGRDVAIKVIQPELSASLGHGRFLREIEIAARLRHPNIVPLYDSGEVGGSLFFVMPYEEGRSLRERLRDEGALPIADALSVLRDVARALAYAHDRGVVHRDVKPDNVMLSGDAAVVTDFGIAKAVSAALIDGGAGPTLTQAGSGIGTPAYMAPEQAMGDPGTDHRADIYSFGCLAYEVFTGTPPFPEPTSHQVVAAHLTQAPRSVTELRKEVPPAVAELIAHCLAKLPGERPQNVRDVLRVLDGTTTHSGIRPSPIAPRSVRGTAVRRGAVAVALTLLAYVGYRATRAPASVNVIKLAVLPLANLEGDTGAAFLTDGLPDEIATMLGRVPGIQIQGRTGARAYSGQLSPDITEAGRKLGAEFVLTGAVRRESGNWILSLNLDRAANQASLWAEHLTINRDQRAGVVKTTTDTVLVALRSLFPKVVGNAPAVASASTKSEMASFFYLGGKAKLQRRQRSVKEAAESFTQAINEDSAFAPAWSGLSLALAFYPYFEGDPARSVYERVLDAAARSIRLDSTRAEPHVARALAYEHNLEWQLAEAEFRKALMLEPNHVEAHIQYGRFLGATGKAREALGELEAAWRADPESAVILSNMANRYMIMRRLDSARVFIDRALQSDKENLSTRVVAINILLMEGRIADAAARARAETRGAMANYALVLAGDTATAMDRLRVEDRRNPEVGLTRAFTWLALNDTAQALGALEQATAAGEIWFMTQPVSSPIWDPVRGSARFAAIVQRLKLPPSAAARLP
jgi:serine/threonine-protein kinase